MERPSWHGGMPPKVSKVFAENKDSSCCHQVSFSYMGLNSFMQTTTFYFKCIFWEKVCRFAILLFHFMISWFTNSRKKPTFSPQPVHYPKGAGSRNPKQICYLCCCLHVTIVLCTDFGGWGESTQKLLLKIHRYLCNYTTYECFVCSSAKYKSQSSK